MIPKSVHYCWFGRNPLPKDVFDHIDSWKRYCPDVRGLIRSFTVLRAQAAELIAGITARSGKKQARSSRGVSPRLRCCICSPLRTA